MSTERKTRIPSYQNREYMLGHELKNFTAQRTEGTISFFRVGFCHECGCEVLKDKHFCSKKCMEKNKAPKEELDDEN